MNRTVVLQPEKRTPPNTSRNKSSNTQRTENTTSDVVIHQHSRKLLKMDILMSETCWAHNKWNKIASDIKFVFHSSRISAHLLYELCFGIWPDVLTRLQVYRFGEGHLFNIPFLHSHSSFPLTHRYLYRFSLRRSSYCRYSRFISIFIGIVPGHLNHSA